MPHYKQLHRGKSLQGAACTWLMVWLATSGAFLIVEGVSAQQSIAPTINAGSIEVPPMPKSDLQSAENNLDKPKHHTVPLPEPVVLPFAEPTSIALPSIGVQSDLIAVGKLPDGTMEVPRAPNFNKAAWYKYSPSPGQYGAAIIVGHVDSSQNNGASVFYNLSRLKIDEPVNVVRADQTTAKFTIRAIRDYGKSSLPDDIIYKPLTDSSELRLITCSGKFDSASRSYESVTVVFATLLQPPLP